MSSITLEVACECCGAPVGLRTRAKVGDSRAECQVCGWFAIALGGKLVQEGGGFGVATVERTGCPAHIARFESEDDAQEFVTWATIYAPALASASYTKCDNGAWTRVRVL